MHEAWQQVQADTSIEAVVLYSEKPGNFVAGADISMLGRCTTVDEASKLAQGGQSLLCVPAPLCPTLQTLTL